MNLLCLWSSPGPVRSLEVMAVRRCTPRSILNAETLFHKAQVAQRPEMHETRGEYGAVIQSREGTSWPPIVAPTSLSVLVPVYNEQYLVEASLARLEVLAESPLLRRGKKKVGGERSPQQNPPAPLPLPRRDGEKALGRPVWGVFFLPEG